MSSFPRSVLAGSFRRRAVLMAGGLCLVAGLSACTSPPPTPDYSQVRFNEQTAMPVRARKIDIQSTFTPTFQEPHVEHMMPVPPEKMARRWVLDRLQPVRSGDVTATFVIKDAGVVEVPLKTKTGVKGAFTTEPAERYDAVISATLTFVDPVSGASTDVETEARHSMTVQEGASINDREEVWFKLVEALGKSFDKAMTANLKKYAPNFVTVDGGN